MIALQDKLKAVQEAFVAVLPATYHYERPPRTSAPYAIWKEDTEDMSIEADNHKTEQAIVGYLDYFTQKEFDPVVDAFQEALNSLSECQYWRLESVDFEDETRLIHFRWSWRVS